ncbi:unnamed protein product [Bursaphelenchus xylophilus]|uniref:(pine wood nematode) hypothetical protein n=1 Tax=Bursaphelenchus xylophilus TaxID=6326 RepID=A0A1I7S3D8_BURXY|nr:unnamed protein product [Bursaphelenchus xylophilus]CAG9116238.1 unnamed protein product [Bursaphelenchus xylophilus]
MTSWLGAVLVVSGTLLIDAGGYALGGGCGCGLPPPPPPCPPPPPMPICPPPPPPCPPPPICPPTFCPPPPICPPPLPPPPPPMCPPPPPPSPCGYQTAMVPYQPPTYQVAPPSNDCCCQCGSPCKFRGRARTHGARIFSALAAEVDEDPTCNNEKLRNIIIDNIDKDPTISKRAIQAAAEEKLFAKINVICGKEDFSYVIYTDTYCQSTVGEVTCYAFRPLGPGSAEENK